MNLLKWITPLLLAIISLAMPGVASAQSGSFVIPSIRGTAEADFAYWDLFRNPSGSSSNYNYNNPPALLDGTGMDDDGNLTTAFGSRTHLRQTGTDTCFVTSSGALYSFAEPTEFEVPYEPPASKVGEVTNVVFQTQTGGVRMDLNSIRLVYAQPTPNGPEDVELPPIYKGLDDPQTGGFTERLVSAFQWDLTGLNIRSFKIVFASPDASMPLWQAQLDAVVGAPFVQELGYLLTTRSRPLTRFGRVGSVDKNLPAGVDGRYFLPGEALNLLAEEEDQWMHTGWFHNGAPSTSSVLPITLGTQDLTVTALFAPSNYTAWREAMFNHANPLLGLEDDYEDDAISGKTVDHDGDGLINAGEYAFGSDPYEADAFHWRPQMALVQVEGVIYSALRYRTNGAPASHNDTEFVVQISTNDGASWTDNSSTPTTTEFSRVLQADGSAYITERTLLPASAFTSIEMRLGWSAAGINGDPILPAPPEITTTSPLAEGREGQAYSVSLAGIGGTTPYTWTVSDGSLPEGLALSGGGVVSGTPLAAGTASFTVQMTDANSVSVTRALQITIQPLLISTGTPLPSGRVGVSYTTPLTVIGGTAPFEWTVTEGSPPAGLTLDSFGSLSGIPSVAGEVTFSVQVKDANDITATKVLQVTIQSFLITTASPLAKALAGAPYPATAFAATGGTAPFEWTVSAGALPSGLTLSSAGVLSGAPTTAGTRVFSVRISDANSFTATKEFSLTVVDLVIGTASPLPGAVKDVAYTQALTAVGGTVPYTWQVSAGALPAGLTLNAAGLITGTTSTPGTSNFTVRLTDDTGFAVTKDFSLTVFASYQKPVVNPIAFGTTAIGASFSYTVSAANYPKNFTITGLPAGLKYVAATGAITGRPSVSGVFNVQVKATNSAGAGTAVTAPLVVKALPATLVGTFTGIIERDATANAGLGSRLTLTTTTKGSYTAKVTTGSKTVSATGFLAATAPHVSVSVGGATLNLDLTNNLITGTHGGAVVSGYRSTWNTLANPASNRAGYYSVAIGLTNAADEGVASIPQGIGFATFTVTEAGSLTVTGKSADGQTISSAAFIGPDGQIVVYSPLYSNKGTILGEWMLEEDPDGSFDGNVVSGTLNWRKPVTTGNTYAAGFEPIDLNVYGKYLAASAKEGFVLGLPDTGAADLVFMEGGDLPQSETDPNLAFTYTDENKVILPANAAKLSLAIKAGTGSVSGKFTLTETTPKLTRGVNFLGQVVRLTDGSTKAVGFFLLAQKPTGGQPAAKAPILSGGFLIEQP